MHHGDMDDGELVILYVGTTLSAGKHPGLIFRKNSLNFLLVSQHIVIDIIEMILWIVGGSSVDTFLTLVLLAWPAVLNQWGAGPIFLKGFWSKADQFIKYIRNTL